MYGDLAQQLVVSAHRGTLSTGPPPLPKYALSLILSICLETRQLGTSIAAATESHPALSEDRALVAALAVQHLAARRNKRCLLAYLAHRLAILKDRYFDAGGALNYLLSPAASSGIATDGETPDLRSALSPHELDFTRRYNALVMDYKSDFLDVLDLTAPIDKPPGELMVDVRVVRDAGEVFLEGGERVEFRKGERFRLERSAVQHLIVQGFLEEV